MTITDKQVEAALAVIAAAGYHSDENRMMVRAALEAAEATRGPEQAPAAQGEAQTPFGYYRIHLSVGTPDAAPEYDIEFVQGDVPDNRPNWYPLYTTTQPSAPGVEALPPSQMPDRPEPELAGGANQYGVPFNVYTGMQMIAYGRACADAQLKLALTGVQPSADDAPPFQQRVQPWMMACFGAEISADRVERNQRFFEEASELVQANGMPRADALALVDYVYSRPAGELAQEVGGVMVTLAALCLASDVDMHAAGETELARIWTKIDAIRAKQASKPPHSPLPAPEADEWARFDAAMQCALAAHIEAAMHAMWRAARAQSSAAPAGATYFSYGDDMGGFDTHATAAEARAAAEESLGYFRDDAPEGWNDGVRNVCWGVLLGEIVETESRPATPDDPCYPDCSEYVEYELRDCAAPVSARDGGAVARVGWDNKLDPVAGAQLFVGQLLYTAPPADARDGEIARLQALLNTPELHDFAQAVVLEAAHQRERWGNDHDAGKKPSDWFWLVGYLAGKALAAHIAGNSEKALHHTISTSAALANWHAAITGEHTAMQPGHAPSVVLAEQAEAARAMGGE